MKLLFIRNLFFTVLHPGLVVGVFPFLIDKQNFQIVFNQKFGFYHALGLIIFLLGFIILAHCISNFAIKGKGTLSPIDPTKQLVTKGLYKYSRNPMYIGVISMLIGECIFTQSKSLLVYSSVVFIVFNLFIIFMEEPRLKRAFGKAYDDYLKTVKRWI